MSESTPIYSFTSHIAGKNAQVHIFSDRIEWEKKGIGGKLRHGLGAATLGMSYLVTGVTGKQESEVIPMRSISSVTTKKGMMNTLVKIIAAGNAIEMNVSHQEAKQAKDIVNNILAGGSVPAQIPSQPAYSAPVVDSAKPDMNQLIQWHRDGVLSDEEFAAAKRAALGI